MQPIHISITNLSNLNKYSLPIFVTLIFFLSNIAFAQHRGDNLTFQGLENQNETSIKAAAMGGALSSISGDINSILYNPAGLAKISKLTFTIGGNSSTNSWRENQVYRPNRFFVTLPFYLEGLYVPDAAENGKYDHERLWENQLRDSTYFVSMPETGLDPFGEDAADWKRNVNNYSFNNVAIVFPLELAEQHFAIALSYNRRYNVEDFDRNDTYLDPHIGYDAYGAIGRVDGVDTLIMNWWKYKRERSGSINSINSAIAYRLSEVFQFGMGMNVLWGSTDDYQLLEKVGTFDLIRENRFRFSYESAMKFSKGKSDFSSASFNLGFQGDLEKFNIGINLTLPNTITREWNYEENERDSISNTIINTKGKDEIKLPLSFQAGVSFNPIQNFTMAIDYGYLPYSKAEVKLAASDKYYSSWADKQTLSFGIEYKPFSFLTIMGGYQNSTEVFIPDGAALKDQGPKYDVYSGGLSIKSGYGEFNLAYQYKSMRYYDSYYSNTNYVTEVYTNLLFGYTIEI